MFKAFEANRANLVNTYSSIARDDLATFFGPRAEKYLKIHDRVLATGNPFVVSFSAPVFFFSFVWFFYRRMYLIGALVLIVPVVLSVLFGVKGLAGAWSGLAVGAKLFYYQVAVARLKKADTLGLVGAEREDYLRRAGGVSIVAGVLAGLLFAALAAIAILAIIYPENFK